VESVDVDAFRMMSTTCVWLPDGLTTGDGTNDGPAAALWTRSKSWQTSRTISAVTGRRLSANALMSEL
jgi:hypothetical protein